MRKLPIGIQGFAGLRNDKYIYVDKTDYIYKLVCTEKVYFLSRPRRFGKSLFISTMKSYWQGKKDLFHGLKIEKLTERLSKSEVNVERMGLFWIPHPVFHFDFDGGVYSGNLTGLESRLDEHLRLWENEYNIKSDDFINNNVCNTGNEERLEGLNELGIRFRYLVTEADRQTGQRAVVLVDEYDKPLLEVMDQPELERHNKIVFKGFFGSLKAADEYLEFVFITGVTKFEKVSVFSDLNQLRDISLNKDYAGICGITEQEVRDNFAPEIKSLAEGRCLSPDECLDCLKQMYDGYHFHQNGISVYNPFSLLNAFADREFRSYWFETGTPTFLVNKIANSSFDVRKLANKTLYADERRLSDYRADNPDLVPLLYQTGYLTIVDYDEKRGRYTLSFPNEEVKYGMLNSLLPAYAPQALAGTGLDIFSLDEKLEDGDLDGIRDIFIALFAMIPYSSATSSEKDPFENYLQAVIFIVFTLLGQFVMCEMHTATGRIDCVLKTKNFIYIFEFKRDDSVENALKQIEENGYALPFVAEHDKTLYKIGVVFDSGKRILKEWKVVERTGDIRT